MSWRSWPPLRKRKGRTFKLIVRMVQSGRLDLERLAFRARRERAAAPLRWPLSLVPDSERNEPVRVLAEKLSALRGYRPMHYRYAPERRRSNARWSPAGLDVAAVRFGASIHDIGKAIVRGELSGPGKAHEEAGREWLVRAGVSEDRARFAVTHGLAPGELALEDLLVQLADSVWKGKRTHDLEERAATAIASASGRDLWDVLPRLLDELDELAESSDARLAWQRRFPT